MDRPLSLSFCKGPRVLKFHHTPFSQLHISSGFTTWWPPLQSADAHQLLSVWWVVICIRIRKVQKSEGKYFDTVTVGFVRCSEECKKLQWRCETFRISILLQLAFSRDLFSLQLRVHHKPNVQREIGLNVHILTLFASFSQNCVSLLRLKLKWFCKFYKQSIRYKSLISMIKNTSNTAMNESLI